MDCMIGLYADNNFTQPGLDESRSFAADREDKSFAYSLSPDAAGSPPRPPSRARDALAAGLAGRRGSPYSRAT